MECHPGGLSGVGPLDSKVVIVGILPGRDEMRTRQPFTGQSGQILNSVLKAAGYPREWCYLTNAICHYKYPYTDEDAQECFGRLSDELLLQEPKLIVTLGAVPCKAVTGRDLGKCRGEVEWSVEWNCYVLSTWNPAAALHGSSVIIDI